MDVPLLLVLGLYWICGKLVDKKDVKWYKMMTTVYGKKKGNSLSYGENVVARDKQLPNFPVVLFQRVWTVVSFLVVASLYLYFDGNCDFYHPRMFRLDDEFNKLDRTKGWLVLVFAFLSFFFNKLWAHQFFKRRSYRTCLVLTVVMLTLNAVTLWAIYTTTPCKDDIVSNRFAISFGLYLVYAVWILIITLMTLRWSVNAISLRKKTSNVGYRTHKHLKCQYRNARKAKRYGIEGLTSFYPHYKQCVPTSSYSAPAQGSGYSPIDDASVSFTSL